MNSAEIENTIFTLYKLLPPQSKANVVKKLNGGEESKSELYNKIKETIDRKYPTKPKKAPRPKPRDFKE